MAGPAAHHHDGAVTMTYQFRPAERTSAKPLLGFYAESGCGKTLSSLLLARGFAGPEGKVGIIDTEAGRGEAYVHRIPGGYDVLPMRDNFSPMAFGEALTVAEKAGLSALIIDSASHEWEGVGGVLEMAANNQAAGKKGALVWQQPKIEHQRYFMGRLLQTSVPLVILCMRAKYPMEERPKPGGGKDWVRSDKLEPKQADDILYEMSFHGWIDQAHKLHITRCDDEGLAAAIPDGQMINLESGQRLAAWARSLGSSAESRGAATPPPQSVTHGAAASDSGEWRTVSAAIEQIRKLATPGALRTWQANNKDRLQKLRELDSEKHAQIVQAIAEQDAKVAA
jgi:hypothetical protein